MGARPRLRVVTLSVGRGRRPAHCDGARPTMVPKT